MSQSGYIHIFGTHRPAESFGLAARLISIMRADRVGFVFRSDVPDRSWKCFQNGQGGSPTSAVPPDILTDRGAFESIMNTGCYLCACLVNSQEGYKVAEGIRTALPAEVRGMYYPSQAYVTIGEHDLFDQFREEGGTYFGRATWSVSFFGYDIPRDVVEFDLRLNSVMAMIDLIEAISAVTHDVRTCTTWNT